MKYGNKFKLLNLINYIQWENGKRIKIPNLTMNVYYQSSILILFILFPFSILSFLLFSLNYCTSKPVLISFLLLISSFSASNIPFFFLLLIFLQFFPYQLFFFFSNAFSSFSIKWKNLPYPHKQHCPHFFPAFFYSSPAAQLYLCNYNISLFLSIEMYYSLYLVPYSPQFLTGIPTSTIQQSSLIPQPLSQSGSPTKDNFSQQNGIEISLTEAQLIEAGYENNKKAWSEEEDALLLRLWEKKKLSWKQIAQKMPGRTSKMCYSRYRRLSSPLKQQWTQAEDSKIKELVDVWGENWDKISQYFKKRTAKQIKDHYINYLRPEINKDPWTLADDLLLISLLRNYGKNWNLIQSQMKGRTQNQIKNRYFRRLKILQDKKDGTINLAQKQNCE